MTNTSRFFNTNNQPATFLGLGLKIIGSLVFFAGGQVGDSNIRLNLALRTMGFLLIAGGFALDQNNDCPAMNQL